MKEWNTGSIPVRATTDINWQWPTQEIFDNWRLEFFAIEETKHFEIYLVGGFLEKLNGKKEFTPDIDIILTGCNNEQIIEKLIYEGTKLGIEKYKVFFDILWFENLSSYSSLKPEETYKIKTYMFANKWIEDGKVKKNYASAVRVAPNLWKLESEYPTYKQKQLINNGYIYSDPVLISPKKRSFSI